MHRDHTVERPDRVVEERPAHGLGHVAGGLVEPVEVVLRAGIPPPPDVEQVLVVEPHHSVGNVASHPQQRQEPRGQVAVAEQQPGAVADLLAAVPEQVLGDLCDLTAGPEQGVRLVDQLDHPAREQRVPRVLQVEAASGRAVAVQGVADPNRARDHRAPAGVDRPRAVAVAAVDGERQQVAVTREPPADAV